ncbi:MAG: FkbM family methyltransferase [Bacteriovoracaceae bacterium]|nr:FkbM family methyltransferase [Bacteriovoracaceae bacterium]
MSFLKRILSFLGILGPLRRWRTNREILSWSEHDEKMKQFYSQFLNEGQICFDIGANRGNRTKIFLSLNSKVIGVEPQPECIKFLESNFGNNPQFNLEPIGLAETEGRAEMNISEVDTLSSLSKEWMEKQNESGRFDGIGWKESITVQLKTFDQLIQKYGTPSFAKIDVEGFELNVLKGLSHRIDYLSFEYAPEFQLQLFECIELLDKKFNAQFNFSSYETMNLDFKDWMSGKEIKDFLSQYQSDFKFFGDVYAKTI